MTAGIYGLDVISCSAEWFAKSPENGRLSGDPWPSAGVDTTRSLTSRAADYPASPSIDDPEIGLETPEEWQTDIEPPTVNHAAALWPAGIDPHRLIDRHHRSGPRVRGLSAKVSARPVIYKDGLRHRCRRKS